MTKPHPATNAEHETHVEVDPDAEAFVWVCACGEGDEELLAAEAYLEARRHERIAG